VGSLKPRGFRVCERIRKAETIQQLCDLFIEILEYKSAPKATKRRWERLAKKRKVDILAQKEFRYVS